MPSKPQHSPRVVEDRVKVLMQYYGLTRQQALDQTISEMTREHWIEQQDAQS